MRKARGRPLSHDADVTLSKAMDAFWVLGYSGTSLDRLCEATGLNRPSLYLAFGNKRSLYVAALKRYIDQSERTIAEILDQDLPIGEALKQLYSLMLSIFQPHGDSPRGCFMISTAVPEAASDEEIRKLLRGAVAQVDLLICERLQRAHKKGQLMPYVDSKTAAQIATAVMHTLAIRSRAGEPRRSLLKIIDTTVRMLCSNIPISSKNEPLATA